VKSASSTYVVLGAVAAGERRSRQLLSLGARAASLVAWPAARGWQSPVAGPLRVRINRTADELAREGRELSSGARAEAVDLARRVVQQIVDTGITDLAVERALSSGAFDNVITVVIEHPATETALAAALDSPELDRLIARVMDSHLVDEVVDRLLQSDEMRLILDYVTRSPELRAALAHQTAGLAGDVAVGMRTRTISADDAAERFARALLRRPRRAPNQ
jgi:hypothetical protein